MTTKLAQVAQKLDALLARATADIDTLRALKVGATPREAAIADMLLEANHGLADTFHHMKTTLTTVLPDSGVPARRRRAA